MPIELRRLDKAHQHRRAFAAAQRSCEEPILASNNPWTDLLLDVVVINRRRAVIQIRDMLASVSGCNSEPWRWPRAQTGVRGQHISS